MQKRDDALRGGGGVVAVGAEIKPPTLTGKRCQLALRSRLEYVFYKIIILRIRSSYQ